jgi:hypothetical protein
LTKKTALISNKNDVKNYRTVDFLAKIVLSLGILGFPAYFDEKAVFFHIFWLTKSFRNGNIIQINIKNICSFRQRITCCHQIVCRFVLFVDFVRRKNSRLPTIPKRQKRKKNPQSEKNLNLKTTSVYRSINKTP